MAGREDDLAYGGYDENERGFGGGSSESQGDRGIIGDAFKKLRGKYAGGSQYGQQQPYGQGQQQYSQGQPQQQAQSQGQQQYGQSQQPGQGQSFGQTGYPNQNVPPGAQAQQSYGQQGSAQGYYNQPQKQDFVSSIFDKLHGTVAGLGTELAGRIGGHYDPQEYGYTGNTQAQSGGYGPQGNYHGYSAPATGANRFGSFAGQKNANDVKWHVDGCTYMWAVSRALEGARESIWILDWWLSPELYLRRPPSKNEQYRLDRMLLAAAQRGVRVNIIVYKEVTQALTRKYLSPHLPDYLHSLLPRSTDAISSFLVRMGLAATFVGLEYAERENPLIAPPVTVSSAHTKHTLEALHPNIAVFRHPDHLPNAQTGISSLTSAFKNFKLDAAAAARMEPDALKKLYGFSDDVVLYWAHHEKLLLVDSTIAFMGGLDLCFGRWDTNQHPIADAHPNDLNAIVFPGQDYNNARIADFEDVAHPDQNKVNRKVSSRMGWSDLSVSLQGPVVGDLRRHFVDRWNFIYEEKYNVKGDVRYHKLSLSGQAMGGPGTSGGPPGSQGPPLQGYTQSNASQQSFQSGASQPGMAQGYNAQSQQPYQPPGVTAPLTSFPPPPGSNTASGYQQQTSFSPPSGSAGISQPSQPQYQASTQSHTSQPPYQASTQSHTSQPPYQQQTQQNFPPPPPGGPPMQSSSHQGYGPPPTQSPPIQNYGTPYAQEQGYSVPTPAQSTQAYGAAPSQAPPSYGGTQPGQQPQYQAYVSSSASQHSFAAELEGSTPQSAPTYPGQAQGQYFPPQGTRGFEDDENAYQGERDLEGERGFGFGAVNTESQRLKNELSGITNMVKGRFQGEIQNVQGRFFGGTDQYGRPLVQPRGVMPCQIVRSCTKWSNGTPTEHSVQDAYCGLIRESQHFIYIENQFFITATGDSQKPVRNQVGAAIVERIVRAAKAGQKFKVIVLIPAIPGFAGDLKDESSLGTRAIMEYQYNSINRGGHSIMEMIAKEGFNPMDYIRFYNLRNYDRINASAAMREVEQRAGVSYEDARMQHDDRMGAGYGGQGEGTGANPSNPGSQFQKYQQAAQQTGYNKTGSGRWDTVSECYMLGGEDIRNVPWDLPGDLSEIDAFVSEELYIHTKAMIIDDRIALIGSANLNDRSQLGSHDSEIAIIVEDPTPLESTMNGQPWQATAFAASLRRQLFRKHLGLLRPQNMESPDANFEPVGVPNNYDWGSPEDAIVSDPLSDTFQSLWNSRARSNTDIFRQVFHAVPDDNIRNWSDYKEFYEYYFHKAGAEADSQPGNTNAAKYMWGHVVRDDFKPGTEGLREVKDLLSRVRGTLVEMPLMFLVEEDIAKEGLTLNAFTEEIYT